MTSVLIVLAAAVAILFLANSEKRQHLVHQNPQQQMPFWGQPEFLKSPNSNQIWNPYSRQWEVAHEQSPWLGYILAGLLAVAILLSLF